MNIDTLKDKQNYFEKNPAKTLLVFLLILLSLSLAGFEKYLTYGKSSNAIINNKDGVKRYIRLRENPPMIYTETAKLSGSEQITFKFTTDENGFVQPSTIYNKPDMNIFFLGGSTTECAAVNEENRFPYLAGRLLSKKLKKKINSFNSGVAGNNTMHSINILLNKIIPLEPDIVIMMHNINDMAILWRVGTYWNNTNLRSLIVRPTPPSVYNVIKESIIVNMIPNVYAKIESTSNKLMMKLTPDKFDEFSHVRGIKKTLNKKEAAEQFRQNLKTFVSICQIRGILPVLMTQENRIKTNPDETIKKNIASYEIDYSEFKGVYDAFNEVIREVGQTSGILVIDLAKKIPQDERYIEDAVHFTDAGSKLAAEIIERELGDYLDHLQKS